MNHEDAEEYTQALGQVLAGGWRQRALAWRLGVPQTLGMTLEEWTEQRLGGYVRMSVPERREAVAELADDEAVSNRNAAEILGVDEKTVRNDLRAIAEKSAPYDMEEQAAASVDKADAEKSAVTGWEAEQPDLGWQELPEWTSTGLEVAEPTPIPADLPVPVVEPEPTPTVPINDGDEWYTPKWLFDALGIKFSLDVCAPLDQTHSAVPAERHLTIEDDGLSQPWDGIVWCNPPYSKPEPWARRMIHHRDGLILTHIPMNAGWCVDMWEACDGIRLFQAMEFVRPDGTSQRPGYWLQLAAFGPVATEALSRLQPLGDAAANKRRIASPMWRRAA
jgi:hypothetical protein